VHASPNITTQQTSTKPRKELQHQTISFRPQLNSGAVNKSKRPRKNCWQCQSASSTSSAVLPWELSETRQGIVSSTSKDIGDLHMPFSTKRVNCRVETGCRYGPALRHGSSPVSTFKLISQMRAGEGLIACESLEGVQYLLGLLS